MELSYGFLYQNSTKIAFNKLRTSDFDGKTSYNVKKIWEGLEKNFKLLSATYLDALKTYCELDEKGNVLYDQNGDFKIKEGLQDSWIAKVEEIMSQKFTIEKVKKIPMTAIIENQNLRLSSQDIEALEPLLDGLDMEF